MNPVRQIFHDAFETVGATKAGRLLGYKVRPLTMWHMAMLHRLDGEMQTTDRASSYWLMTQVLRWPALCRNWRLRLALAEPGILNIRAWCATRMLVRDYDGFEAALERYWEIWFPKPPTKGESTEIGEDGEQKKSPKKGSATPWFLLVVCELMELGFSHDEAWSLNPGYALHLLWANRERAGMDTPLIDEESAAALQEIGAW